MIFSPGEKVKVLSTGEVGIVIHGWDNQELGAVDYHVACYGCEFPKVESKKPPYLLRYLEPSLEKFDE